MTWLINERVGSRKFKVSDDGSARGTISLVCRTNNPSIDEAPGMTATGFISRSLWGAIKDAGFIIGKEPPDSYSWRCFDHEHSKWRVDGFAGVQPETGNNQVWYVDVALSWAGDIEDLYGDDLTSGLRRRDIDVMIGAQARDAAAYADWWRLTNIPSDGDADWQSPDANLLVASAARVDVNGSPIIQKLPGARMTVTVLDDMGGTNGIENTVSNAKNRLGHRNKDFAMAWAKGKVVLEAVEYVQVGHGFGRATYRFHADEFYHLQQEAVLLGWDNSQLRDSTSTLGSDVSIVHAKAVYRQPYPLTSADMSWDLEDIFGSAVATYLGTVYT